MKRGGDVCIDGILGVGMRASFFFLVQNRQADNCRKAFTTSVQLASIDEHSGMLLFSYAFIPAGKLGEAASQWISIGIGPRFK